jgi:hypothetical protein
MSLRNFPLLLTGINLLHCGRLSRYLIEYVASQSEKVKKTRNEEISNEKRSW